MKIGELDLGQKLLLAPMADISDSSFRKICKEQGAGLTYTQMISAKGVIEGNFDQLKLLAFDKREKPLGVQILGSDPGIIGEAVKEIAKYKPDVIDINSGCPIDKVTKHNFGACILDNKILLGEIVKSMVNSSGGIPISVKIRLGRDEKNINILENARVVEENGASLLVVHTRTRKEKYYEPANWNDLAGIKKQLSIPLVGNGSVFTPTDAKNMIEQTGCDSVMIARGALGTPFIFSRFNKLMETGIDPGVPGVKEVTEVTLRHLDYLESEKGEFVALGHAKKNFIWYFREFNGISKILDDVFSINKYSTLREYVQEHAEKVLKGEFEDENFDEIKKRFLVKVLFWLPDADYDVARSSGKIG